VDGSVDGIARAGVETADGAVGVVSGPAGFGEGGFDGGVSPVREVENDDVSDVCLDFLRLENQAGILCGSIATDYDGDRLGRCQ